MDGFVLYAGRPAAPAPVRPPEWFAKWTGLGCRDCAEHARTCTPVSRTRREFVYMLWSWRFSGKSDILFNIRLHKFFWTLARPVWPLWGALIDFIDSWIALHKDLNNMIYRNNQMFSRVFFFFLRGWCQRAEATALLRCSLGADAPRFHMRSGKWRPLPGFPCSFEFTLFSDIWLWKKSHTDFHINARIQLVKRWFKLKSTPM